MPKRKQPVSEDPDKLVRREAGTYRTADDRFEARQGDVGWFLVDTAQTNEFGQELMHGPFATLKVVRGAIPSARSEKVTALRRPRAKKVEAGSKPAKRSKPPAPPRAPSWIDRLGPTEAGEVRRLIAALEAAGVEGAEALVRRDREGLLPVVATRLLERRLDELVEGVPSADREAARTLVRRIATVLTGEGLAPAGPMPGWTLVELGSEPAPSNRRIELD